MQFLSSSEQLTRISQCLSEKAMAVEGGLVAKLTRDSKVVTEVLGEKVKEDRGGGSVLASRHVHLLYFFSLLSLGEFLVSNNTNHF